jgi:hypothetical protein
VDIYAISDRHECALRIEVKTSQKRNFVTRIGQKWKRPANNPNAPDFWVLFQVLRDPKGHFAERFFVLTHSEICKKQAVRNGAYRGRFSKLHHGKKPDISTGVDNILVKDLKEFENQWSKIVDDKRLKGSRS